MQFPWTQMQEGQTSQGTRQKGEENKASEEHMPPLKKNPTQDAPSR
jgi:hypothetical protein